MTKMDFQSLPTLLNVALLGSPVIAATAGNARIVMSHDADRFGFHGTAEVDLAVTHESAVKLLVAMATALGYELVAKPGNPYAEPTAS